MERKIGDTFEFEGKKLQVKAASKDSCEGCFLDGKCTRGKKAITGFCKRWYRDDEKRVIFVEVQEQQAEEPKERKVGEVFEYQGKKLKVVETAKNLCFDCYFFDGINCQRTEREGGECSNLKRADYKPVIFVEVHEQPQELNLCEILKYCPQGEIFWSPLLGDVKFHDVNQCVNAVFVTATNLTTWRINHDATIKINGGSSPETMLYPSRTQRDWSKFTAPWLKKEKFDPKTLKPFDEVVVRNIESNTWRIEYFSHINERRKPYQFYCSGDNFAYCIPYNDDTKHLVGTKDEAPEYYRYWEG